MHGKHLSWTHFLRTACPRADWELAPWAWYDARVLRFEPLGEHSVRIEANHALWSDYWLCNPFDASVEYCSASNHLEGDCGRTTGSWCGPQDLRQVHALVVLEYATTGFNFINRRRVQRHDWRTMFHYWLRTRWDWGDSWWLQHSGHKGQSGIVH